MTPSIKRRVFLRSFAFFALSPISIASATFPQRAVSLSKTRHLIRKAIQPIDDDYIAVDGWVISKKQLTH